MSTNHKEYMRQYMKDYRNGLKRENKNKEIRDRIKQDRLAGDDIYTISLRYGYRPESIARICQKLPIKKHVNRHKLYYAKQK